MFVLKTLDQLWSSALLTSAMMNISTTQKLVILSILYVFIGLLGWRIWQFSVVPWLRPKEPKELPYLVPGTCCYNIHMFLRQLIDDI